MGLRLKFNLVLLAGLLTGMALASVVFYRQIFASAREQVLAEAALMNAQADAISGYTSEEVAPLVASQLNRRFLPQSVPAWAAQANFHAIQKQMPDYSYRVVMLNPTNPADAAEDWHRDIIGAFKASPGLKQLVTERQGPAGPVLTISRPVVITDATCLACHSTPDAAPASMIELYGSKNGFGWTTDEVLGARIVSVPMAVPLARAWDTFKGVLLWLALVFAIVMVLLNLMLHATIIRPVRRIAAVADELSRGNMNAPSVFIKGHDEIASLGNSFNRVRRTLVSALKTTEA